MANHPQKIAYILKGFPRTSETFITNEIYLLEQTRVPLTIFSLKRLTGQKQHGVVEKIKAPVVYLPETSPSEELSWWPWLKQNWPSFSVAHRALFRQQPLKYLKVLCWTFILALKYRVEKTGFFNRTFLKEFLQAGFIAQQISQDQTIAHLHAHFAHTTTTVTMLASALCELPFSFTAHAKDIYAEGMNPGDLLAVKMRRAKFVITCTKANEQYLKNIAPQTTLFAIYHGLDLSLFVPSPKPQALPSTPPLILAVGRLVEKKGFSYLIEACRILKAQSIAFTCHIVGGDDKYGVTLRALIQKLDLEQEISLPGAVTQEELRQIYERSTVFALPCQVIENGDRDGIPNVLVEAMAMEMPVISTNISGIPELIDQGVNGLMVPSQHTQALAEALTQLLAQPALREQLGSAARQKVCRFFDAQRNIRQLKDIFLESLSPKK